MKEGYVILTPLPQTDGRVKNRPALLLREFPPYGDFLVCGLSTQLRQFIPNLDDLISRADADFSASGLIEGSVIRLGFLAILPRNKIVGVIGAVSSERHARLLERLASYLTESIEKPIAGRS